MKNSFEIYGKVSKFPGKGGWFYIEVPKKYTESLKEQKKMWGMYPIIAKINETSWKTKLMMKKGGDFFVALNKEVRIKKILVINKGIRFCSVIDRL